MSRFIAIVDTPSNKHKMVICPIFETIEETEQEAKRTQFNHPVKILDIDWTIEKQQIQNDLIARLINERDKLREELALLKANEFYPGRN